MANFSQFMQQVWICHWTYLFYKIYTEQEWSTDELDSHLLPMIEDLLTQLISEEEKKQFLDKKKRIVIKPEEVCKFLKEVINDKKKAKVLEENYAQLKKFFLKCLDDYTNKDIDISTLRQYKLVGISQLFMISDNLTRSARWLADFPSVTIGNYPIKKNSFPISNLSFAYLYYISRSVAQFFPIFSNNKFLFACLFLAKIITRLPTILFVALGILSILRELSQRISIFNFQIEHYINEVFPFLYNIQFHPQSTVRELHDNFQRFTKLDGLIVGFERIISLKFSWYEPELIRDKEPVSVPQQKITARTAQTPRLHFVNQLSTEVEQLAEIQKKSQPKRKHATSTDEVNADCSKKPHSILPQQLHPDLYTLFLTTDDGILAIIGIDNAIYIPKNVLELLDEHGEKSLGNALENQRSIHNQLTQQPGLKYFDYKKNKSTIKLKGQSYGNTRLLLWFCNVSNISNKDQRWPIVQQVLQVKGRDVRHLHTAVDVVDRKKMFQEWPQLAPVTADETAAPPKRKIRR